MSVLGRLCSTLFPRKHLSLLLSFSCSRSRERGMNTAPTTGSIACVPTRRKLPIRCSKPYEVYTPSPAGMRCVGHLVFWSWRDQARRRHPCGDISRFSITRYCTPAPHRNLMSHTHLLLARDGPFAIHEVPTSASSVYQASAKMSPVLAHRRENIKNSLNTGKQ